jgi:hypothetical protein
MLLLIPRIDRSLGIYYIMATPTPLDPEKFIPFTLYALLIGIAAALTVEVIKDGFEPPREGHRLYLWILLGMGALSLVILSRKYDKWLGQIIGRRNSLVSLNLYSSTEVAPAKGLLFPVSRGGEGPYANYAIDHHQRKLTHLWLLHSSDAGSLHNLEQIRSHRRATAPEVKIKLHQVDDMFSIEIAKSLVEFVRQEAKAADIRDDEFICDFTGMTKPISAGVVLACIRPEYRLQYMEPGGFLSDGRPDPGAGARPVEVRIGYDVELPAQ